MSTGSEPFSLLISLDATIFVLPTSVLILIETICQKRFSKSRLRVQKVQFRLTYVAQKRRCLNTLFFVARLFSRPGWLPVGLQGCAWLRRENTLFHVKVLWRTQTQDDDFFYFPELRDSLLEFSSTKTCQHLTNWTRWNEGESLKQRELTFFKWPFVAVVFLLLLFRPQTRNAVVRRILYDTMKS